MPKEYLSWLFDEKAFDTRASVVAFTAFLLSFATPQTITLALFAIGILFVTKLEPDPRTTGKLTLKMTERASVLHSAALFLSIVLLTLAAFLLNTIAGVSYLVFLVVFQLLPVVILLANSLLKPFENAKQNKFLNEAKQKIREVDPLTIGITGSYGKTSTKNILAELLQATVGHTFWPEKGINTPMGITRSIREKLKSHHKYAVVEMGAFKRGSIKRLCDLAPPKAAIVTAVGLVHLDRFGSPEDVYQAKSELPQAVPDDGILVCNGDDPLTRKMATEFKKERTFLYGTDNKNNDLDCVLSDWRFDRTGSHFTLSWNGQRYEAYTKLVGMPALSNIAASFTMAAAVGVNPELLVAAMRNINPVDNRLSLSQAGEVTYLNDAYNSNPAGFSSALDILAELDGKRRILVTPGMIELGSEQQKLNKEIAIKASSICDQIYLVSETNRAAWLAGLKETNYPDNKLKILDDRTTALSTLQSEQQPGDVVLIENDLPDLFEQVEKF